MAAGSSKAMLVLTLLELYCIMNPMKVRGTEDSF